MKTVKTNHFLQHKILVFASVYGICLKKKAREKVVRSNQNTSRNKISPPHEGAEFEKQA